MEKNTATPAGTALVNDGLWGARARDWADVQEGQARALYDAVLEAIAVGRGTQLLDAGCGAGMAVMLAAARGATVTGIDASDALLAIARERVPDAELHRGELEALPFPDAQFDAVTGFNAFQYAATPVAALREARRVARAGAPVVIATWGRPNGMPAASLVAALRPLLPPPPPGAPGPFALSDEVSLRALATDAGLAPDRVADVETTWTYPDLATALRGLNSSGVAQRAIRHAGEDAVTGAHADALAPFQTNDGGFAVSATFRYLIARA
jgi:SAM-dependent methyltransferase